MSLSNICDWIAREVLGRYVPSRHKLASNNDAEDDWGDTWHFEDTPNTCVISLRRIFKRGAPIMRVLHEANGEWQALDGGSFKMKDAWLVGLGECARHDPTILQLADLPRGWMATRTSKDEPWVRCEIPLENQG